MTNYIFNYIFDITRSDYQYKGVLFAEIDFEDKEKFSDCLFPAPTKDYISGLMCLIWVDEVGNWNCKGRIKFPSGNKQVFEKNFGKDANETKCLTVVYKILPLKNKCWYPNPDGSTEGILKIMEKSNMIESIKIEKKVNSEKNNDV